MDLRRATVWVPAILTLAVLAPVIWPLPVHVGDWFFFWFVGHIMATGGSPLDGAAWHAATTYPAYPDGFVVNQLAGRDEWFRTPHAFYPYPPWYALLFVAFGALPVPVGITLMHIAIVVAGIAAAAWLTRKLGLAGPPAAFALAAAILFQPFVLASRTGHATAVLLLGALAVASALDSGAAAPLVVGALLLSWKPHLGAGFAIAVLVLLVRRRAWRGIALTAATLGAVAAIFFTIYPLPLDLARQAVVDQAGTDNAPTTWALAAQIAPGAGLAAALVALAAGAVLASYAIRAVARPLRTLTFIAVSLALSLAIAPYVHTYDQILLLPALLLPIAVAARSSGPARLIVGTAIVAAGLVYPWIAYFGEVNGDWGATAAVPFLLLLVIALATGLAARDPVAVAPATGEPHSPRA